MTARRKNVSQNPAKRLKPVRFAWFKYAAMKALLLLLTAAALTSCWAAPRRHPLSPGGPAITPMERHDRSVLSPGGRAITPRERYHRRH